MSPKSNVPLDRLGTLRYVEGQGPGDLAQVLNYTSGFLWALAFGLWADDKGVFL